MNKTPCFSPAHILLPSEQIPVGQWGCVACDQFTSDRSYWEKGCAVPQAGPEHTGPDPAGGLSGRG